MTTSTIYPFHLKTIDGEDIPLSSFENKVLLIVNTASECRYTPQYEELEQLQRAYKDQGFSVLAIPSNDFGEQEPLEGRAIAQFCQNNYQISYPLFHKEHVKGPEAIDLYKFLTDKKQNGRISSKPRWNFHKYLINRQGEVINYYFSFTKPNSAKIRKAIEKCLAVR